MQAQKNTVRELSASGADMLATARVDLACYALANYPAFELPPFLDLVISKLEAVKRGEIKRLILSMPPRHGKSLIASTYFPASYLGTYPDPSSSRLLADRHFRATATRISDRRAVRSAP